MLFKEIHLGSSTLPYREIVGKIYECLVGATETGACALLDVVTSLVLFCLLKVHLETTSDMCVQDSTVLFSLPVSGKTLHSCLSMPLTISGHGPGSENKDSVSLPLVKCESNRQYLFKCTYRNENTHLQYTFIMINSVCNSHCFENTVTCSSEMQKHTVLTTLLPF